MLNDKEKSISSLSHGHLELWKSFFFFGKKEGFRDFVPWKKIFLLFGKKNYVFFVI